ncbi:MAG: hypothetical protein ABEI96_09150 [Haloarculaceae archaeon]
MTSSNDTSCLQAELSDLSERERHRLLASDRRRVALDALATLTPPVDLTDLATTVARQESGPVDPRRVEITLHHQHLPLLADLGVVAYDPDARRVVVP